MALSGTLPAGGYLVVADQAVSVAAGATVVRFPLAHDVIQNGAPDGVALIDTVGLRRRSTPCRTRARSRMRS